MVPLRDGATDGRAHVALLTEIPAPYRIPLFNALAERVDLRVLFLRERHSGHLYDLHRGEMAFEWRVLPGVEFTVRSHWFVLNTAIGGRVRHADAVVLGGWNQPAFWEALAWCNLLRLPVLLWVESTVNDNRSGRHEGLKRLLLRRASGFIVPGTASCEYLQALGIATDRITVAPNAVDTSIFGKAARDRTHGPCRVIVVARLSREKGVDILLRAVEGLPVEVLVAGSGPEEKTLRELAGPNVTFLGNVERDQLPQLYADADIAVVPSRSDTWGMVLNEAALAGLPLIASSIVGGARDLIEDGVNGFCVPPENPGALREALQRLVEDEGFRRSAGARSREISARFTPRAWADAVTAAVEDTQRSRR